jgi:homoaconitase
MTDTPWELKAPNIVGSFRLGTRACVLSFLILFKGIHLKGKMGGWTTPKDLILHIAGKLTVRVRL